VTEPSGDLREAKSFVRLGETAAGAAIFGGGVDKVGGGGEAKTGRCRAGDGGSSALFGLKRAGSTALRSSDLKRVELSRTGNGKGRPEREPVQEFLEKCGNKNK